MIPAGAQQFHLSENKISLRQRGSWTLEISGVDISYLVVLAGTGGTSDRYLESSPLHVRMYRP